MVPASTAARPRLGRSISRSEERGMRTLCWEDISLFPPRRAQIAYM